MLGFIALAGIIIRNSVILVDQSSRDVTAGLTPAEAIVEATVRRARPILLTAAAAVLALVPLSLSVFWGPMAIAIMGGLLSATALTLFFVPALDAAWVRAGCATSPSGERRPSTWLRQFRLHSVRMPRPGLTVAQLSGGGAKTAKRSATMPCSTLSNVAPYRLSTWALRLATVALPNARRRSGFR